MSREWFRHGFWNTLEQALTRSADALTSLVLIWALHPEGFSQLVLAQAWIAPTLLVFLTPESVVYRDFAEWRRQGPDHVAARVRALRLFSWWKFGAALVASAALAPLLPSETPLVSRFWSLLWAYGIALGPQVAGADREFLRMELRLREINVLTVVQKATVLLGTVGVALLAHGEFAALAAVALLGPAASAILARRVSMLVLRREGATAEGLRGDNGPKPRDTIVSAILTFSLWNHVATVLTTWVRTMDLFFLGLLGLPARELGLYGAAYKLANLATALPVAATNLFSVWVGRRGSGLTDEKSLVRRMTKWVLAASAAAAVALWLCVPLLFPLLSRGRWTAAETQGTAGWIAWLLVSATLFAAPALVFAWLSLRTSYVRLVREVSLPWTLVALAAYPLAIHFGGSDAAARVGVLVSAVYVVLAWVRFRRTTEGGPEVRT
jgi:hypothetical protein